MIRMSIPAVLHHAPGRSPGSILRYLSTAMTTIRDNCYRMEKSVRSKQWEISESLLSCLKDGMVLNGQVGEIIECCGSRTTGHEMAKYLERAETMQRNRFRVNRKKSSGNRCIYRITLKDPAA